MAFVFAGLGDQAVQLGQGQQLEGNPGHHPRIGGDGGLLEKGGGVGEGDCHPRITAALQRFSLQIVAHQYEAAHGELTQRRGSAQRLRHRRLVQVEEHGAGSRVVDEPLPLLTGVLQREEQPLGGGSAGVVEGIEERQRFRGWLGAGVVPVGGERAPLLQVGGDEVDDLMKCRCQRHFLRRHRRPASVGRLEHSGIDHDLVRGGGGPSTEAYSQLVVAGQRARQPGDGRRDPLIAGHHVLHGPLLGGQDLAEQGRVPRVHNLSW